MSSKPEWLQKAERKSLPAQFISRLEASTTVSEAEKEKIVDALKVGVDVPEPLDGGGGLVELPPDQLPTVGLHYVVWGPGTRSMRDHYPVLRAIPLTEERYVEESVAAVDALVAAGLKDPDPLKHLGMEGISKTRAGRAADYARWRYRGVLAKEIAGL